MQMEKTSVDIVATGECNPARQLTGRAHLCKRLAESHRVELDVLWGLLVGEHVENFALTNKVTDAPVKF
jgi:hypothetical protein